MATPTKTLKKVWHFLWEDNSVWSWLANVILAFILIKFVVYPGLGLLLGTAYPVVAVVSGSMEHHGAFDQWWDAHATIYEKQGITKSGFGNYPFPNGFNKGDVIVLKGLKKENIKIGKVVVFRTSELREPVIHRIVHYEDGVFTTKGDFNKNIHSFEQDISTDTIIGEAYFRIPLVGYIKIWFVDLMRFIGVI